MVKVGLDIGHGNNTFPPSKGFYKNGKAYHEHTFNAKLGIRLKELLEHNGITVVLGQQPNKPDVSLPTRTNLYEREKVDIVFSTHANWNDSAKVNGRCAFYWHSSTKGKRLAMLVIEEIKSQGYSTHGNGLHASKIGSWTNLHITRVPSMPAVLVEHGFMSGDKDFNLIFGSKQNQYIEDMATADAKAICRYFGMAYQHKGASTTPSKPSPSPAPTKPVNKTAEQVAQDISKGLGGWGNNPERAVKLTRAGYNAKEIQKRVNEILSGKSQSTPKKTVEQVAQEIYKGIGNWGNGDIRKRNLKNAGYDPSVVQKRVNELVSGKTNVSNIDSIARQVIKGVDNRGRKIPQGNTQRALHFGMSLKEYELVRVRVNQLMK